MRTRTAAVLLLLFLFMTGCGGASEKRVVGYYTYWSAYKRDVLISDIDGSLLTHLNYAFVQVREDGSLSQGGSGAMEEAAVESFENHCRQLAYLRQRYPQLKIMLSVGGWTGSGMFSEVAADSQKRCNFAQSAAEWMSLYGFDGLDIDWEYPVQGGNDIVHRPEDRENYTLLIRAVREAFDELSQREGKTYLLSIAGGAFPEFTENIQIKELCGLLDFINIMSYDYHGGWEERTGANAPLYGEERSIDKTVRAYLQAGAEPSKLNLGLPFYGRGWIQVDTSVNEGWNQPGQRAEQSGFGLGTWEGSSFAYWDLAQNYLNHGYIRGFDPKTRTPYLYGNGTWISYDDEESIACKVDYCLRKGLGGVMCWELAGDRDKVLQQAIAERMGR